MGVLYLFPTMLCVVSGKVPVSVLVKAQWQITESDGLLSFYFTMNNIYTGWV
jgi:hypothetical protein